MPLRPCGSLGLRSYPGIDRPEPASWLARWCCSLKSLGQFTPSRGGGRPRVSNPITIEKIKAIATEFWTESRPCRASACGRSGHLLGHLSSAVGFLEPTAGSGIGGSSNGRTADSDSACQGSNPCPPANKINGLARYKVTFLRVSGPPVAQKSGSVRGRNVRQRVLGLGWWLAVASATLIGNPFDACPLP